MTKSNEEIIKRENEEIIARANAIFESEDVENEYCDLLAQIYGEILSLIIVDSRRRTRSPPCNQCIKNYDTDDYTTCVVSQAVLRVFLLVLGGVVENCKARAKSNFVYPDIISRLEDFFQQNLAELRVCEE